MEAPRGWLAAALAIAVIAAGAPAEGATKPARARDPAARTGRAFPPLAALVKATRKNDRAAVERLAARLGVARLGEAALALDAPTAEAALGAIPLARGGVLLSGVAAERLDSSDPVVADAAARALGALLSGDVAGELAAWEVPGDVVARACGGLSALAGREAAPPSTRLAALDALALARPACGAGDLARLARDRDPAVRRAAVLALPPGDASSSTRLAALADADPGVATAGAASVCRAVDSTSSRAWADAATVAATGTARALAAAPATRAEDAVEMLACLAATRIPADRALLARLRDSATSAPAVRARARDLLGPGPGKPE